MAITLELEPVPGPGPAAIPVQAPVTQVYGDPLNERVPAIAIGDGQAPEVQVVFRDDLGRPRDLDAIAATLGLGSAVELTYAIAAAEAVGRQSVYTFSGQVITASQGLVGGVVVTKDLEGAGVYLAECAVSAPDGLILASQRFYLLVERSLFRDAIHGPPTRAELRAFVRDSAPAESRLLDNKAWDDAEIAQALIHPITYFNAASPPLSYGAVSTHWPWTHWWLEGAKVTLFRIAAEWYRRNRLPYQAGGAEIDDHGSKAQEYEQLADMSWKSFTEWVKQKKVSMNLEGAMMTEASPYALVSRGWYPLP